MVRAALLLLALLAAGSAHATSKAVFDSLAAWHRASRPDRVDSLVTIQLAQADSSDLGPLLLARGRTRAAFGLARESEPDLRTALDLSVAAADTAASLDALRWLIVAISQQGRAAEALALAQSLEDLARAADDSVHLGWAWMARAYDHHLAGRAATAGALYGQVGAMLRRAGVLRGAIWAYNGEGLARRQAGDLDGAAESFRRTADLARAAGDALSEAMALSYLGRLELLLGDPAVAEALLWRAATIHDRHQHHREGLLPRVDLAVAKALAGRRQAAVALLDSVLVAARAHGLADLAVLAANQLADLHLEAGRPVAATALSRRQLASSALSTMARTEVRLRLARGLAAQDSVAAALKVLEAAARDGHGARSLQLAAEGLRGRLLVDQGRAAAALGVLEPLQVEASDLQAMTALGRARLATGDTPGALAVLTAAVAAWDTLRLRAGDPFWRERRSAAAGDLFYHATSALLQVQSDEAAAFELLQRYKARTLLERVHRPQDWDRTDSGPPVTLARVQQVLAPGEVLLEAVAGQGGGLLFQVTATTVEAAPLKLADLARLAGAARVFWCPDAELHGLALAPWLPPQVEVARLPAAGVLVRVRERPAGSASPVGVLTVTGVEDLAGAAAESAWLAAHLHRERGSWRQTGGVLHLAAHVDRSAGQPWLDALVLDGERLTAAEVAAGRVAAALVVLAGCRTAGGEVVGGEGLLGLASGFLVAGAPVVLATLWDVDDHVSARFMAGFYTALLSGRTVSGSVLAAQEALRADPRTAAPACWAGFVVVGDGARKVPLRERRPVWPWVSGLLVLAVVLAWVARFRITLRARSRHLRRRAAASAGG